MAAVADGVPVDLPAAWLILLGKEAEEVIAGFPVVVAGLGLDDVEEELKVAEEIAPVFSVAEVGLLFNGGEGMFGLSADGREEVGAVADELEDLVVVMDAIAAAMVVELCLGGLEDCGGVTAVAIVTAIAEEEEGVESVDDTEGAEEGAGLVCLLPGAVVEEDVADVALDAPYHPLVL